MVDRALATRLLALRDRDLEIRARLAESGELYEGYAGEMERLHGENARALAEIVGRGGWPGASIVGAEAAEAAWLVAQHAIACPALQRAFHAALQVAVESGDAPLWHLAYLTDRIRFNERRPQVYGTIHDWDETDEMSPWPVEAPEAVAELRQSAGLPPLAESTARLREEARRAGVRPRQPFAQRQARQLQWARDVGWLPQGAIAGGDS